MTRQIVNLICAVCGGSVVYSDDPAKKQLKSREYCSNNCKQMAYLKRRGFVSVKDEKTQTLTQKEEK